MPFSPTRGREIGGPAQQKCGFCEAVIEKTRRELPHGSAVWLWPDHSCPQKQAHDAAAKADEERRRSEWLETPPAERVRTVLRRANLPAFAPAGLKAAERRQKQAKVLAALADHRKVWLAGGKPERGLWLWGASGAGKSTLLAALAFDVAHRTQREVLWWDLPALFSEMKKEFDRKESRYDPSAIRDAELFCLDEIPPMNVTDWACAELYQHANAAYVGLYGERRQRIYVTSNYSPEQVARMLNSPDHPDRGTRIVGRLTELCEVVEVTS